MITIPNECNKINILASGGVDSTILLFLLLKQTNGTIPIKVFTFEASNLVMTSITVETTKKVLQWLENYFGIKIPMQIIKKRMWIRRAVEDILLIEGGCVYTGCNKVLHNEFTPTVYIENDTPPVRGEPFNEFHIRPFINVDKKEIIQLYMDYNILDLLRITKSCGKGTTSCKGCYFCMERQWAVEQLGIADI